MTKVTSLRRTMKMKKVLTENIVLIIILLKSVLTNAYEEVIIKITTVALKIMSIQILRKQLKA